MRRTLVEYLDGRLGVHEGNGPEYKWHCPVCIDRLGSEGAKRHLHINTGRGFGHCFRCDYAFRSFEAFFRYLNDGKLKIEEARLLRRRVKHDAGGPKATVMRILAGDSRVRTKLDPVPLPKRMVDLTRDPLPGLARRGLAYLKERGLGMREIRKHSIGFCPVGDYAGYLVFPVFQGGRQVYFTTRFAGQVEGRRLKSKNPKKSEDGSTFTKGTVLLNYDAVVGLPVIGLVEGPFDVMGFGNAVGLLGKSISDEQVALLDALVDHGLEEVVIALDDEAARQANAIHKRLLGRIPHVTVLYLDHGDPFDRRADLKKLLRQRRQPTVLDRVKGRRPGSGKRRKRALHVEKD